VKREGDRGGRKGKAGGKGEPAEGEERREGECRDKSPAWSSQDLGSTGDDVTGDVTAGNDHGSRYDRINGQRRSPERD